MMRYINLDYNKHYLDLVIFGNVGVPIIFTNIIVSWYLIITLNVYLHMFTILVLALISSERLACTERCLINHICRVYYKCNALMLCFELILCLL